MMENNKIIVPIVLAADHSYAMPLGVAITSIVTNKKPGHIFKIYILDGGLDVEDKQKLGIFIQSEVSIEYLKINTKDFALFPEKRHLKLATYYRLIAPAIVKYPKIIYIDSDTIVNIDLIDLFKIDLGNKVFAAVKEVTEDYAIKYFIRPISRYFNAGVLLIDTKKWQEENIWEKATDFINHSNGKIRYADQDILNHLLEDKWLKIDKSFNFQLDIHQDWDNRAKINILHFVGPRKPWHYIYGNKYRKYFLDYLKLSPWRDYRYPDKNLKTFLQRYFLETFFVFFKKLIKRIAPMFIYKILKNIFCYFCNLRDSK